jgi:hypothetical protein
LCLKCEHRVVALQWSISASVPVVSPIVTYVERGQLSAASVEGCIVVLDELLWERLSAVVEKARVAQGVGECGSDILPTASKVAARTVSRMAQTWRGSWAVAYTSWRKLGVDLICLYLCVFGRRAVATGKVLWWCWYLRRGCLAGRIRWASLVGQQPAPVARRFPDPTKSFSRLPELSSFLTPTRSQHVASNLMHTIVAA